MENYRILVINPGSTSTKVSYHINKECIFKADVFHDSGELLKFGSINDQLDYRMEMLEAFLAEHDIHELDAVVGRGGGCYSVESGTYYVDEQLIKDTREYKGGLYHSSMLGVQMAERVQKMMGGVMLMVDPPVVDELDMKARITGVKGIYRTAICHALNLKEVAKVHARSMGKNYEDLNLIVCHIDGGISVTAHKKGRMIDGNDAGGGQGPFTPTRMGSMSVTDVINKLKDHDYDQIKVLCSQGGGLSSHFGTSNSTLLHERMENGDEEVRIVWEAMIYQVCKEIGSMAAVLKGQVDGIVLTGGLLRFPEIEATIVEHCGFIAPVTSYEGEMEHEAMANNAYLVLTGQLEAKKYPGKPVFSGQ